MLLKLSGEFRTFGVLHRDEVLNAHRVEHLTAKAFSNNTGVDTLACGIDCSRCTGRTTAHDQHVKGRFCTELFSITGRSTGVDLGEDFFQTHTALREGLTIQQHGWHSHDLAVLDLFLEQRAVNGDMADLRIENGNQVQRLHHVRAVLAGEREIRLELHLFIKFEGCNLVEHLLFDARRVTTNLQKGEDQ